jgi:F-type H+-transporting ATPase subunit gamma
MSSLASKVTVGPQSPRLIAGTGKDQVHLLVVATSERGLAGAFNTNIVRAARKTADELIAQGKTVKFYLIGKKGRAVISRLFPGKIIHQVDQTHIKNVGFHDTHEVSNDLIARYEGGEFDVAHLFYSHFHSALVQEPKEIQIIPVPLNAAPAGQANTASAAVEYEPDEESILAALLPRNVAVQLFRAMLENAASEQGSRMTAMDNATRNAGEMINKLTVLYNRTRQAAITTELIEIIAGAEAL